MTPVPAPTLRRELGKWDLTAIGINQVIGGAVFLFAVGVLVGYGHSAWATATGTGEVWFDSIAVLTAALMLSGWL